MKNQSRLTPEIALSRLMEICSRKEKSPYEIEKKLKEWGLEKFAVSILNTLKKENFLDHLRFAKAFSNDKVKFNKWGKNKVRFLLKGHQIEPSVIEESLSQISMQDYESMICEEMDKKLKTLKATDAFLIKNKLYAFGNQRGYESDIMIRYFESKGY
jgi:regulatory protein